MVWRSSVSSMVAVVVGLLAQAQAFEVTLVNSCSESIDVFDSKTTETLQVGGSSTRTISPGGAFVYRKGTGGQATLAEFSADNNAAWYDISIIPTGEKSGPGYCGSLEECKEVTGGVGFNGAMSIEPSETNGDRCVSLTCMEDGCSDAYQYPKDDTKTHACASSVDFTVTFCPGGSSAATTLVNEVGNEAQNIVQQFTPAATTVAPTEAPTQPPTEAPTQPPTEAPTQPPTEAPTLPPTEAPTQPPTEVPTLPPTEVPTLPPTEAPTLPPASSVSNSASSDVDAGDSQWNDFIGKVGAHNETSSSSSSDVTVGDDESESGSGSVTQSSATTKPASYQKTGTTVVNTAPSALQTSGNDDSVQQANTQSSEGGSSGAAYIVLCIGAAVGAVAVAAIVVIRKKKQAFDEMDNKTPVLNTMRDGPTDHSVLMTATNSTSAVL